MRQISLLDGGTRYRANLLTAVHVYYTIRG